MAEIEIIIKVQPSEYDVIIDALLFHRDTLRDELDSPINDPSTGVSRMRRAMLAQINSLLLVVYGSTEVAEDV